MDTKNKNIEAPGNSRKTPRSGSLKSSVGSMFAEIIPTPVEAPPAWHQNTGDKKTTSTSEKTAASKPKPAAVREASKPEANKPEASKPRTTQGESSSKNNNVGAMDFAALLNKQMEEFRNIMISRGYAENNYILGLRFMDRHLIYRKIDIHDKQPKVYKIDGKRPRLPDVDSPGEC